MFGSVRLRSLASRRPTFHLPRPGLGVGRVGVATVAGVLRRTTGGSGAGKGGAATTAGGEVEGGVEEREGRGATEEMGVANGDDGVTRKGEEDEEIDGLGPGVTDSRSAADKCKVS